MIPVNPEAIGLFGLFATVICFGLEQLGVGVKGADHEKLTRTLGYIAIFFGGFTQLFTSLCIGFTIRAFQDGLVWPLGIDLVVIDVLLLTLIPAWYTGKPALTKLAGLCNVAIGVISAFLLFPALFL